MVDTTACREAAIPPLLGRGNPEFESRLADSRTDHG